MTDEKWQQSIPLHRKEMDKDGKELASSSSSATSIQKPKIMEDEVIVNQSAMVGMEEGIPPPSLAADPPPLARAQSPIISAFIDQRLEDLRQQYPDLDSMKVFADEGDCASNVSISSSCSYHSKGSEYTLERLKKAGPEFQKFVGLLEMLTVDEDEGDDLESRLVHTGLTQTQTQTEMGWSQSQSQSQGLGPLGAGLGSGHRAGFYL